MSTTLYAMRPYAMLLGYASDTSYASYAILRYAMLRDAEPRYATLLYATRR